MGLKETLTDTVTRVRERSPFVDHVVRTVQHYGAVQGNIEAGAVTYFAFLSFFPILALGFAVVGFVARVYPDAEANLISALEAVLPGMVGTDDGQISIADLQKAAPSIFSVGLLLVLYSGLGWLSTMRDALGVVFALPARKQPNFIVGKARDLGALVLIGVTMVASVAVSQVVSGLSEKILRWVGLSETLSPLLKLLTVLLGLGASMVLFFVVFRLLANPGLPRRAMWGGAVLGAIGFEALKRLSGVLLEGTKQEPAFQAFGIALILLVWINYFSRLVMYAAAWARTHPLAREVDGEPDEQSEDAGAPAVAATSTASTSASTTASSPAPTVVAAAPTSATTTAARSAGPSPVAAFLAGCVSALGAVAALKRRRDR